MDAAEAYVSTPNRFDNKTTGPYKASLTRSSIRAVQTIYVPQMTQVLVMRRCLLSSIVHTDPNHSVFVSYYIQLTNGIHEIDLEKPFIVFFANFFNVPRKMPNNMVLVYATRCPALLFPVDSTLVAHIHSPSNAFPHMIRMRWNSLHHRPPTRNHRIPKISCSTLLQCPTHARLSLCTSQDFAKRLGFAYLCRPKERRSPSVLR